MKKVIMALLISCSVGAASHGMKNLDPVTIAEDSLKTMNIQLDNQDKSNNDRKKQVKKLKEQIEKIEQRLKGKNRGFFGCCMGLIFNKWTVLPTFGALATLAALYFGTTYSPETAVELVELLLSNYLQCSNITK